MREAAIIDGTEIVNVIVLADGYAGDETLEIMSNAVEITDMMPKPGLDNGWAYVKGKFVPPPEPETTEPPA